MTDGNGGAKENTWVDFVNALREGAQRFLTGLMDVVTVVGLVVDEGYCRVDALNMACIRYGWCFTPDFPLWALVGSANEVHESMTPQHRLYVLIRDYFRENDWLNLRMTVSEMRKSGVVGPKRCKVLEDCVRVLVSHGKDRFNAANVVVPTLMALVDGLLTDFARGCGIKNWHDRRSGDFASLRRELESVAHAFDRPALDLIFVTLFSSVSRGATRPRSGRRFNRHLTLHGNWIGYGRIEHVLRLILIISFLDYIIDEYRTRAAAGVVEAVTVRSRYAQMLSENPIAPLREMMRERVEARGLRMQDVFTPRLTTADNNPQ